MYVKFLPNVDYSREGEKVWFIFLTLLSSVDFFQMKRCEQL